MLQNIKLKKKLELSSDLSKENQELKELVKVLSQTLEELKARVDMLREQVSADNILGTLVLVQKILDRNIECQIPLNC